MLKGQTSTDLLITIVIATIFFSAISVYANQFSEQSESAAANNSLRAILLDVYATAGSVKAYGQTIEYVSPKFEAQSEGECEIQISAGGGSAGDESIIVTDGIQTASFTQIDIADVIFNPATFKCGEKTTISK